jgi:hypothetical protein
MSSLIRKKRIHFSPTMAAHFGLYEAIILQFLFWVKNGESAGKVLKDGYRYCYNTYSDWHQLYPFISERTLRRTFVEMEAKGLICSIQLNGYDRTKFYRISDAIVAQDANGYFDELPSSHDIPVDENTLPCGQDGLNDASNLDACTNVHKSHESFPELLNSGDDRVKIAPSPELVLSLDSKQPLEPLARKRGRPPKPADPRHQEAIDMWNNMWNERFNSPYCFHAKDFKHLKTFLQNNSSVSVVEMRDALSGIWTLEVQKGAFAPNSIRILNLCDLVLRWNTITGNIEK